MTKNHLKCGTFVSGLGLPNIYVVFPTKDDINFTDNYLIIFSKNFMLF